MLGDKVGSIVFTATKCGLYGMPVIKKSWLNAIALSLYQNRRGFLGHIKTTIISKRKV